MYTYKCVFFAVPCVVASNWCILCGGVSSSNGGCGDCGDGGSSSSSSNNGCGGGCSSFLNSLVSVGGFVVAVEHYIISAINEYFCYFIFPFLFFFWPTLLPSHSEFLTLRNRTYLVYTQLVF